MALKTAMASGDLGVNICIVRLGQPGPRPSVRLRRSGSSRSRRTVGAAAEERGPHGGAAVDLEEHDRARSCWPCPPRTDAAPQTSPGDLGVRCDLAGLAVARVAEAERSVGPVICA